MHGTVSHRAPHAPQAAELTQMREEGTQIFVYDTRLPHTLNTAALHYPANAYVARAKDHGRAATEQQVKPRNYLRFHNLDSIDRCSTFQGCASTGTRLAIAYAIISVPN